MRTGFVAVALCVLGGTAYAQVRWTVDARPLLTLGRDVESSGEGFANVVGAVRRPDGRIIVGDFGAFALREFAADGKPLRRLGRKGAGPGEIGYLKSLLACGDSLYTLDIEPSRVSVFTGDLRFVRSFRFGVPPGQSVTYATVCNDRGVFAHQGWEDVRKATNGVFRTDVPFWLTGSDDVVRQLLGSFPGSERFGHVIDGKLRGIRPLPLGKQPVLAIGADRVYIGAADRYELGAYAFTGKRVATIRRNVSSLGASRADMTRALEEEIALRGEKGREELTRWYASIPVPSSLPAYSEAFVDARGLLWVRDYPRPNSATVRWSVFSPEGALVAEVALPVGLRLFQAGADFILGGVIDEDTGVPLVQLLRLRRG